LDLFEQTTPIKQEHPSNGDQHSQKAAHDEYSDDELDEEGNFIDKEFNVEELRLTPEELKKAEDKRYFFDFSGFPQTFPSVNEALDTYNEEGYKKSL